MVMDTNFATVACCLLAISFIVAQAGNGNSTVTTPTTSSGSNLTQGTTMPASSNSTVPVTVPSNTTENTTPSTSTTSDSGSSGSTAGTTTASTSQTQTSQSAAVSTPLTDSTSLKTTTPSTQTPAVTTLTTQEIQNTTAYISTPDTPATTTGNSSVTISTTSDSVNTTAQGLSLNNSEKNMTIAFSSILGVFALAMVFLMLHKCKLKIQYLHQPLNNTDDTDAFVADNDTLVISGGLYDGHPIYDNVPETSEDQSQFRLEFLH